ncbi:MAG: tetratricopeptide repeat protein [Desulfitobacterium sp.]|nr:tetratricopeptide repeat protein [Desulfitobacterium sp.]
MKTAIPPDIESILKKTLGLSYTLPLQPRQISILIAKATGHILSFEQSQWIYSKTEGYFPPLSWIIDILKEFSVLPRNPENYKESLEKKAFPYFKELLDSKIPSDSKLDLLVLSLLPHEIHPHIPDPLLTPKAIHLLMDALEDTPWLTLTSPKAWKFHPLFHDYLKKNAQEDLPTHEEIYQNLIKTLIAKGYPLEAEELLLASSPTLQGSLLYTLGEALAVKGHKEKALTILSKTVLAFGQENDTDGIIRSLNAMGTLCLELGKKEEAGALYLQLKEELPPEKLQESFIPAYLNLSIPKLHICCLGELKIERGDQLLDWKKMNGYFPKGKPSTFNT